MKYVNIIIITILFLFIVSCGEEKKEVIPTSTPTVSVTATATHTPTPTLTPTATPTELPKELRVPEITKSTPIKLKKDETISLEEVGSIPLIETFAKTDGFIVEKIVVSRNQKYIAVKGNKYWIQVWDLEKKEFLYIFRVEAEISSINFSYDETELFIFGESSIRFSIEKGTSIKYDGATLLLEEANDFPIDNIKNINPERIEFTGTHFFVQQTYQITFWETYLNQLSVPISAIHVYDLSSDSLGVSFPSDFKELEKPEEVAKNPRYYDKYNNLGQEVRNVISSYPVISDMVINENKKLIAYISNNLKVYNYETGQLVNEFENELFEIKSGHSIALSPDGQFLATMNSNSIDLIDIDSGEKQTIDFSDKKNISGFTYSSDGSKLLMADREISLSDFSVLYRDDINNILEYQITQDDTRYILKNNTIYRYKTIDQELEEVLSFNTGKPIENVIAGQNSVFVKNNIEEGLSISHYDIQKRSLNNFNIISPYSVFISSVYHDGRLIALLKKNVNDSECILVDFSNREYLGTYTYSDSNYYNHDLLTKDGKVYLMGARYNHISGDKVEGVKYGYVTIELLNPFDLSDYYTFNTSDIMSISINFRNNHIMQEGYDDYIYFKYIDKNVIGYSFEKELFYITSHKKLFSIRVYDEHDFIEETSGLYTIYVSDVKPTTSIIYSSFYSESESANYSISPNKRYKAVPGANGRVTLFDLENEEKIKKIIETHMTEPILSFSSDSAKLFAGGHNGQIFVIDVESWNVEDILYPDKI